MKQLILLICLGAVLFQSGCAIPPPIEQQTLQQSKQDQSAKKSDDFARSLSQ
ncbi:MAG TPA: hypothetical protein VGF73_08285 [Chthoniobacterales bacterium]|jgi:hypothetical protein